jgi:hypothetical protein
MVELVRAGKLHEDDRVRGEMSSQWTAARDVVGLFRTATSAPVRAPAREAPSESRAVQMHEQPVGTQSPSPKRFRVATRVWTAIGGGFLIALVAAVSGWWSTRSARFPAPQLGKVAPGAGGVVEAIRAPRPKTPSVPNLQERSAQPVPGLERRDPAFSPCLTPDLRTIVFAGTGNPGTGYDLYLATRADISLPFDAPRLIRTCASPETDAYPAISADGLELIFARSDSAPQFFRCTRRSISEEFGQPKVWAPAGYDPAKKQRIERPQLLDQRRLAFCFVDLAADTRRMMAAERADANSPFGRAQELPFSNPWPLYYLAESGLRAYHGTSEGIFLAARRQASDPFGEGTVLLGAKVTGPVDGPLWVAPQEDVIFYCSPGPGKELGSGRRLWMVRY